MHACFMFGMAGVLRTLNLSDVDMKALTFYSILMGWGNSLGSEISDALGEFKTKRLISFENCPGTRWARFLENVVSSSRDLTATYPH